MPTSHTDNLTLSKQNLKAACWFTVTKIIEDQETTDTPTVSENFAAALAEAVFAQAQSLGRDLEAFAHHAGRTTIQADDVKLACRKNDALYELIETEAVKNGLALAETKIKPKPKPRARPTKAASTSTSKGKEKATTSKKRAAKVVDSEEEAEEDDVDDDEEDRDRVDTKRGKGAKPPAKRRSKKASDP